MGGIEAEWKKEGRGGGEKRKKRGRGPVSLKTKWSNRHT